MVLLGRLIGGEVVAVSRVCPHHGRNLDGGALYADEIDCPHHHYTYDPHTGENLYPKRVFPKERAQTVLDIRAYRARDDGEWVWVDLDSGTGRGAGPGRFPLE